ncbi:MAG: hypothetical protein HXY40_18590 [Chloroflexi bacterium]|nr:hypothetical protein [Chloroflexota bacterium]
MKSFRLLLLLVLLGILLSAVFFVRAVCNPSDTGTAGNDSILCDTANQPSGIVTGEGGDDLIVVEAGVVTTVDFGPDTISTAPGSGNDTLVNNGVIDDVYGDSNTGSGSGNDTLINNGTSGALVGDAADGVGSGNDTLINNGTTADLYGDSQTNDGSGSDTLINNGIIIGEIVGDSVLANGSGDDTIINNGVVLASSIYGDSASSGVSTGNDTITNNGTTNSIYGDNASGTGTGNDTITNNGVVNGSIIAGGGSDTVIMAAGSAVVGGTIDGGAGYDVLTFNVSSTDPAVILDAAQRLAAANPAGGTIVLLGQTYTWTNFEELAQLIFSVVRLNGYGDPLAVFCALGGGIEVYVIAGQQGVFALSVSSQTISNGLARAAGSGSSVLTLGTAAAATVYATSSGQVQVNHASGFSFMFTYQLFCGGLPDANGAPIGAQPELEDELPGNSIINRPFSG